MDSKKLCEGHDDVVKNPISQLELERRLVSDLMESLECENVSQPPYREPKQSQAAAKEDVSQRTDIEVLEGIIGHDSFLNAAANSSQLRSRDGKVAVSQERGRQREIPNVTRETGNDCENQRDTSLASPQGTNNRAQDIYDPEIDFRNKLEHFEKRLSQTIVKNTCVKNNPIDLARILQELEAKHPADNRKENIENTGSKDIDHGEGQNCRSEIREKIGNIKTNDRGHDVISKTPLEGERVFCESERLGCHQDKLGFKRFPTDKPNDEIMESSRGVSRTISSNDEKCESKRCEKEPNDSFKILENVLKDKEDNIVNESCCVRQTHVQKGHQNQVCAEEENDTLCVTSLHQEDLTSNYQDHLVQTRILFQEIQEPITVSSRVVLECDSSMSDSVYGYVTHDYNSPIEINDTSGKTTEDDLSCNTKQMIVAQDAWDILRSVDDDIAKNGKSKDGIENVETSEMKEIESNEEEATSASVKGVKVACKASEVKEAEKEKIESLAHCEEFLNRKLRENEYEEIEKENINQNEKVLEHQECSIYTPQVEKDGLHSKKEVMNSDEELNSVCKLSESQYFISFENAFDNMTVKSVSGAIAWEFIETGCHAQHEMPVSKHLELSLVDEALSDKLESEKVAIEIRSYKNMPSVVSKDEGDFKAQHSSDLQSAGVPPKLENEYDTTLPIRGRHQEQSGSTHVMCAINTMAQNPCDENLQTKVALTTNHVTEISGKNTKIQLQEQVKRSGGNTPGLLMDTSVCLPSKRTRDQEEETYTQGKKLKLTTSNEQLGCCEQTCIHEQGPQVQEDLCVKILDYSLVPDHYFNQLIQLFSEDAKTYVQQECTSGDLILEANEQAIDPVHDNHFNVYFSKSLSPDDLDSLTFEVEGFIVPCVTWKQSFVMEMLEQVDNLDFESLSRRPASQREAHSVESNAQSEVYQMNVFENDIVQVTLENGVLEPASPPFLETVQQVKTQDTNTKVAYYFIAREEHNNTTQDTQEQDAVFNGIQEVTQDLQDLCLALGDKQEVTPESQELDIELCEEQETMQAILKTDVAHDDKQEITQAVQDKAHQYEQKETQTIREPDVALRDKQEVTQEDVACNDQDEQEVAQATNKQVVLLEKAQASQGQVLAEQEVTQATQKQDATQVTQEQDVTQDTLEQVETGKIKIPMRVPGEHSVTQDKHDVTHTQDLNGPPEKQKVTQEGQNVVQLELVQKKEIDVIQKEHKVDVDASTQILIANSNPPELQDKITQNNATQDSSDNVTQASDKYNDKTTTYKNTEECNTPEEPDKKLAPGSEESLTRKINREPKERNVMLKTEVIFMQEENEDVTPTIKVQSLIQATEQEVTQVVHSDLNKATEQEVTQAFNKDLSKAAKQDVTQDVNKDLTEEREQEVTQDVNKDTFESSEQNEHETPVEEHNTTKATECYVRDTAEESVTETIRQVTQGICEDVMQENDAKVTQEEDKQNVTPTEKEMEQQTNDAMHENLSQDQDNDRTLTHLARQETVSNTTNSTSVSLKDEQKQDIGEQEIPNQTQPNQTIQDSAQRIAVVIVLQKVMVQDEIQEVTQGFVKQHTDSSQQSGLDEHTSHQGEIELQVSHDKLRQQHDIEDKNLPAVHDTKETLDQAMECVTMETIDETMETTDEAIESIDETMETIEKTIETLNGSITPQQETIHKTIETIDKTMETINETMETTNETIETIDETMEIIDKTMETMVDKTEDKIREVEEPSNENEENTLFRCTETKQGPQPQKEDQNQQVIKINNVDENKQMNEMKENSVDDEEFIFDKLEEQLNQTIADLECFAEGQRDKQNDLPDGMSTHGSLSQLHILESIDEEDEENMDPCMNYSHSKQKEKRYDPALPEEPNTDENKQASELRNEMTEEDQGNDVFDSESEKAEKELERENRIRSFEMLVHLETIKKELQIYHFEQTRLQESFKKCVNEVMSNLTSMTFALKTMQRTTTNRMQQAREEVTRCYGNLETASAKSVAVETLLNSYSLTQNQCDEVKQRVKDLEVLFMALNIREIKERAANEVSAEINGIEKRMRFTESDVSDLNLRIAELEQECRLLRKNAPIDPETRQDIALGLYEPRTEMTENFFKYHSRCDATRKKSNLDKKSEKWDKYDAESFEI